MPAIERVLETSLYVDDLDRAAKFYERLLQLQLMRADDRMRAYAVGETVLLLFARGQSLNRVELPDGTIPPHDGSGPLHVAFAISAETLDGWVKRLEADGIEIEGRARWPRGGESIYFRDPDGHLLEFATPGLWRNY
ncbi:MAG: VOC family protein [Bradyrhizobiaceae bacterium]|nr:VOC family protein [Bradyrhizobiaceae bacterium]